MRLVIRKDAEADITEGHAWYERQQRGIGAEFLAEVSATLSALHSQPKRFPLIHRQLRRAILQRFPYGIFFAASSDTVVVLAVLHLARSPQRSIKRWDTPY